MAYSGPATEGSGSSAHALAGVRACGFCPMNQPAMGNMNSLAQSDVNGTRGKVLLQCTATTDARRQEAP